MDSLYQVRMRNDYEVLFTGTIFECERWVHTDGMIGVTYEIAPASSVKGQKPAENALF